MRSGGASRKQGSTEACPPEPVHKNALSNKWLEKAERIKKKRLGLARLGLVLVGLAWLIEWNLEVLKNKPGSTQQRGTQKL